MKKETRTTCPYCGVGCGLIVSEDEAGTHHVKGDPDHPSNFGRLCSKGLALAETIGLEGRLLFPKVDGRRANWDAALGLVAQKFSDAIAQYGPDSVAFYVSGQLLTEDYYVANKLMKGYIGSANIDTNSRLCMASSVAGHKRAFGTDTVPGNYEDLELADLVVLVGSNMAWCHPVLFQRLMAAKEARHEMKLVVVEPRRSASAELCDLHIPISGEQDIALFNHLLLEIEAQGAVDAQFVREHVEGFDAALNAARATAPSDFGENAELFDAFARLWMDNEKVVTVYSQGVNQSEFGTDKVNAILNCHLATGRIGKAGMGPLSLTGQPNAMGGREVGGLANMLAAHLDLENSEHRQAVQDFWQSPAMAPRPGLKAVDLFDAVERGEIKALWIMSTNPVVSMPDADRVKAAIENCPFVVVSDIMELTDTTQVADVVLPAKGWGEKTGTVTNSERMISAQRAFLNAPSKARADWQIICDVAQRMGWQDGFDFKNPAEILREYAALSAIAHGLGKDFEVAEWADMTDADYADFQPRRWPLGREDSRFFSDGQFYTPNGKARMIAIQTPARQASHLRLNTGRIRDQWHTMTRTAKSAKLSQHLAEPFVEIHPDDAAQRNIATGTIARVFAGHSEALLRANVTERVPRGEVFAPMHWTGINASHARVNACVRADFDPISGQPALKSSACEIEPFNPAFYGFAVSKNRPKLSSEYWACATTEFGWRTEFATCEGQDDWESFVRKNWSLGDDSKLEACVDVVERGARLVFFKNDKAEAAIYLAAKPVEMSRSFVVENFENLTAVELLAGDCGAARADPGATVCSCFNVGVNTICEAIETQNLASLEAIGEHLQAGTNCGSCRAELSALLERSPRSVAAE